MLRLYPTLLCFFYVFDFNRQHIKIVHKIMQVLRQKSNMNNYRNFRYSYSKNCFHEIKVKTNKNIIYLYT